jgi:hypothetical protein
LAPKTLHSFESLGRGEPNWVGEEEWLRHRIKRLRVALRFIKDPTAEIVIKELIQDAESRIAAIQEAAIARRSREPK